MSFFSRLFGSASAPRHTWEEDHARLFAAIKTGRLKDIQEITGKYSDAVTWTGPKGKSPLLTAIDSNEIAAFNLLLDAGANKDEWMSCPSDQKRKAHILFYAVTEEKIPFIEALLQRGSNMNVHSQWQASGWHTNGRGSLPLEVAQWCLENGHLKKPLVIDILKRADIVRKDYLAAQEVKTAEASDPSTATVTKPETEKKSELTEALDKIKMLEAEMKGLKKRLSEIEEPAVIDLQKQIKPSQNLQ